MLCPIVKDNYECIEKECALWDDDEERCCILSISKSLDRLVDSEGILGISDKLDEVCGAIGESTEHSRKVDLRG